MESSPGDRVRALRDALGLSVSDVVKRTESELDHSYLTKIERGLNKASTVKVRRALARGFGAPESAMGDYLDGRVHLPGILAAISAEVIQPSSAAPAASAVPQIHHVHALSRALLTAWKQSGDAYDVDDLEAVRHVIENANGLKSATPAENIDAMRVWLRAAHRLRLADEPVTLSNIALSMSTDLTEALEAANTAIDADPESLTPEHAAELLPKAEALFDQFVAFQAQLRAILTDSALHAEPSTASDAGTDGASRQINIIGPDAGSLRAFPEKDPPLVTFEPEIEREVRRAKSPPRK